MIEEQTIRDILKTVPYPGFSRDIVSFGLVKEVVVGEEGNVRVVVALATKDPEIPARIQKAIEEKLGGAPGVKAVRVDIRIQDPGGAAGGAAGGSVGQSSIPGVHRIIAVASGKGGVGKSTVATNLAAALAAGGARVGLCDCDLYGPSIALMCGAEEQPMADDQNRIIPIERHGMKLVSMGMLLNDSSPVIVRGPIATRYTQQFLRQTNWGTLDYLILDLPPGTGDIQLTIVQTVALDGAVIVTTPQEVALIDARKAVSMFDKVNVPILGLIENMSWFECPDTGKRHYLFGRDGGVEEARKLNVGLLAQVPLTVETREQGDAGTPVATMPPEENPASRAFHLAAAGLVKRLAAPAAASV